MTSLKIIKKLQQLLLQRGIITIVEENPNAKQCYLNSSNYTLGFCNNDDLRYESFAYPSGKSITCGSNDHVYQLSDPEYFNKIVELVVQIVKAREHDYYVNE